MENLGSNLRGVWESFLGEVGGYLPNLAAALAILILGWLAALLVAKLVRAALKKTTIDNRIAGWVKGEDEAPDIEPAIGRGVFWLVMIFGFIGYFMRRFGFAVANAGDAEGTGNSWLVGAPREDSAGLSAGRVYLYQGTSATPTDLGPTAGETAPGLNALSWRRTA